MADNVIDQIKKAVMTYPTDKVDVTITSFGVVSPPGGLLNVGDIFRFKVKIENKGCLVMTNAKAHVFGTEWADVSTGSAGPFGQGPVENLTNFVVAAFGSYETGWFYGKAKKRCDPDTKTIVLADLGHWDASLQYILDSASMEGPKEGKLDQIVYPA